MTSELCTLLGHTPLTDHRYLWVFCCSRNQCQRGFWCQTLKHVLGWWRIYYYLDYEYALSHNHALWYAQHKSTLVSVSSWSEKSSRICFLHRYPITILHLVDMTLRHRHNITVLELMCKGIWLSTTFIHDSNKLRFIFTVHFHCFNLLAFWSAGHQLNDQFLAGTTLFSFYILDPSWYHIHTEQELTCFGILSSIW